MIDAWVSEDGHELPMAPAELLAETSTRIAGWNEQGRGLARAFLDLAEAPGV
jgi:hypothetical protein